LEKILERGTCVPRLAPCPVQRRRARRATQAALKAARAV
jgi:hypothetical protein